MEVALLSYAVIGVWLVVEAHLVVQRARRIRCVRPPDLANPDMERVEPLCTTTSTEDVPADELLPGPVLKSSPPSIISAGFKHPLTGYVTTISFEEFRAAQRRRVPLSVYRAAQGRANELRRN